MIIYKAKNKLNDKVYIGQTIVSLNERKGDHKRKALKYKSNSYFHNAIKKYGFNNFKWEIIDTAKNRDELNEKEKYWINFYNSIDKNFGYNLREGGNEVVFTDDVKKRIGDSQRGTKRSDEFKKKISAVTKGELNPFYGKKHSEETKKKISESRKGVNGKYTEESRERTVKRGENNGMCKIKLETVIEIKKDIKKGLKRKVICEKHNCTIATYKNIQSGNTWRHVRI